MSDNASAAAWIVVEPQYFRSGAIRAVKMVRLTQGRPATLQNGERAFRLEIEIPTSVFDPFANVGVVVPESDAIKPAVTVGEQ